MSLTPLFDASSAIQIHAFAAMAAFVLALVQFAGPKGTIPHRILGWTWIGLMSLVAGSSFFITGIELIGPFSPIHLLSIYVIVLLPIAVRHARRGRIKQHRGAVTGLFLGGLVIAGALTFIPGRIMHDVLFGG